MSNPHIDEELIKKYLAGYANESEKELVEKFMQQNEARENFDRIWEKLDEDMNSAVFNKVSDPERMANWKTKIRQRIIQEPDVPSHSTGRQRSTIFKQVAIWTVLTLCGALWGVSQYMDRYNGPAIEWVTQTNPKGQKSVIRLSDNTMVYLGAGSSLKYPKQFKGETREVLLEGEAFFEVAKNPDKRFIVLSDEIATKVLGTSFRIESFKGLTSRVSVSTGQVQVAHISGDQERILANLKAGQQVAWSKEEGVKTTDVTTAGSAQDFMSGKLIFDDRPLADITKILERNYNVQIDIQRNALSESRIRITLERDLALKQVMDVLAASGGFKYTLEKGRIKIF